MRIRDLYEDGRHYDALFPGANDLLFYQRRVAAYGGPVLELACGTGRLTVPLAGTGAEITGIDRSPAMLEVARDRAARHRARVSLQSGDMRHYALGKKFKLIFIADNAFLHLLEREDIESCLRCTRDHLAPDGRFVIDIFTPSIPGLARNWNDPYTIGEYDDPDGNGRIIVTETRRYDAAAQVSYSTWCYRNAATEESWEIPFNLRVFYPQEIDALLRYNGFAIEHKYGDFDDSPYGSASPKQLIVSRPVC
jgi:SAM-dependent methyltransferase